MNPIRLDSIREARETPPDQKLLQALAMMAEGIRLKHARLRAAHPALTEAEVDQLLQSWLLRD